MTLAINAGQSVMSAIVAYTRVETHTEITLEPERRMSPLAFKVLKYIADSSLLSGEEKEALIRLTALVEEFAGGNKKLLRDILGIAKMMEANNELNKRVFAKMPLAEAIARYFEEREKMGGDKSVHISIDTLFEEVSVQFLGVTMAELAVTEASPDSAGSADQAPVSLHA